MEIMSIQRGSWSVNSAISSLLVLACIAGCGRTDPWTQVYPVKGVVTFRGKPVKDAELAFFPVNDQAPESVRPWAKSSENGEFVVSTYNNGDGAPAGDYKVTVIHHEIVISGGAMGSKPNDLPKKYASRDSTDLVIKVESQPTTLPTFDLK